VEQAVVVAIAVAASGLGLKAEVSKGMIERDARRKQEEQERFVRGEGKRYGCDGSESAKSLFRFQTTKINSLSFASGWRGETKKTCGCVGGGNEAIPLALQPSVNLNCIEVQYYSTTGLPQAGD